MSVVIACKTCGDLRSVVNARHQAAPCPDCGVTRFPAESDYVALRKRATREHAPLPQISMLDLSDDEFESFRALQLEHPAAHKLTVLGWMEGRRYDPARDPAVQEEAAAAREAQHARRMTSLRASQPKPTWLLMALRRENVLLDDWQIRIVEEVKAEMAGRAELVGAPARPKQIEPPPTQRRREDAYQPASEEEP